MCRKLLQGPSNLCHYCSPFTSITQKHSSLLHRHSSFIQRSFHNLSILFMAFFSTSHNSYIRSYYSLHHSLPFFPCVQTTLIHSVLLDQPTLVTLVIFCTYSFLNESICVTPHILLRQLSLLYLISSTLALLYFIQCS